MKICLTCKEEKPLDQFNKRAQSKDGHSYHCRPCYRTQKNDYNKSRGPDYFRHNIIKRTATKAGVTVEYVLEQLKLQDYKCKICNRPESELSKKLHVDHCHTTGKYRGMLCGPCNQALGLFKDDPQVLEKAIKYLRES
jgi:hypothetical protein